MVQSSHVAVHGIRLRVPIDWEIAATYGSWRKGQVLIASRRQAVLAVNWQRSRRTPDLVKNLARLGRSFAKDNGEAKAFASTALDGEGLLGTWTFSGGSALSAAVKFVRPVETTVLMRQLAPFPGLDEVARSAEAWGDRDSVPWSIHGLAVTLPPWWRLEGMQHLAGLTRAVWCRYPGGRMRADGVLVLRRMACASQVLNGRDPSAWLQSHLRKRETVSTIASGETSAHLICREPSRNWLRRLRGLPDERHLHAVWDREGDRLVIQEWKGKGEPLGSLLNAPQASQGGALADGREA